jgi:predicted site-specific integrase-resolvase
MADLKDYVTAQEAADAIGISYHLLMARIRKGLIKSTKKGWATLVHKDEVKKAVKYQRQLEATKQDRT